MNINERLQQLEQAHAQHVQLLQQTQANIIRIEGAMEILREQIAEPAAEPVPVNRKARRAAAKHLSAVPSPPAEPAEQQPA